MDKNDRIINALKEISREVDRRHNLPDVYARYNNQLLMAADAEEWEEHEFLVDLTRIIKDMIVHDYMAQNGYYKSDNNYMWESEV